MSEQPVEDLKSKALHFVGGLIGFFAGVIACCESIVREIIPLFVVGVIIGLLGLVAFFLGLDAFNRWQERNRPGAYAIWSNPFLQLVLRVALMFAFGFLDVYYWGPFVFFIQPLLLFDALRLVFCGLYQVSESFSEFGKVFRARGAWVLILGTNGVLVTQFYPQGYGWMRDLACLVVSFAILLLAIDLMMFFQDGKEYEKDGQNLGLSLLGLLLLAAGSLAYSQGVWSL